MEKNAAAEETQLTDVAEGARAGAVTAVTGHNNKQRWRTTLAQQWLLDNEQKQYGVDCGTSVIGCSGCCCGKGGSRGCGEG